jgi:hypothetical protein
MTDGQAPAAVKQAFQGPPIVVPLTGLANPKRLSVPAPRPDSFSDVHQRTGKERDGATGHLARPPLSVGTAPAYAKRPA